MIPQRNLSLLSNELARQGGQRIPEAILERDYCLSWFLVGISQTPFLQEILVFKGGTAIKKCYIPDYRFSEDLDFTLVKEVAFEEIQKGLDEAFKIIERQSGIKFHFSRLDRNTHQNSHTFFLTFEGPLPRVSPQEIKVDITIREWMAFPILKKTVLKGNKQYEDLPEDAEVRIYSLGEIAAEKVLALCDRARNEPRDLYDLWQLSANQHIAVEDLIGAISEKLKFRGKSLEIVRDEFLRKEARLKKLWKLRLFSQMSALPEFDGVYRAVKRELRQSGMLGS